jgi:signal transduction histidine kinase
MNSIKLKLLIILTATIITATLITTLSVYTQIKNETNKLFDYQLKQVAEIFLNTSSIPWDQFKNKNDAEEIDADFAVVVFDNHHKQSYTTGITSEIPYPDGLGYREMTISKEVWHTYSLKNENRTVMFLQPEKVRDTFAVSTAFNSIIPFLLILPIFAILILIILKNGFMPLVEVQETIEKLNENTLEPLNFFTVPKELQSLIEALNKTILRLRIAIEARKNFVADAAHELRTPLSVLKIQLELVYKATDKTEKQLLLHKLEKGIERSSRLVEQLLTLSRQENYSVHATHDEEIDLAQLISEVLVESLPLAEVKEIEFEVNAIQKTILYANKYEIETVISNLIDNAIGYTPRNGLVSLNLFNQNNMAILEISDNGIGIKDTDKTRIFDRFYRVTNNSTMGSGLGLSIVKEICDKYDASIEVKDNFPKGSVFSIKFQKSSAV